MLPALRRNGSSGTEHCSRAGSAAVSQLSPSFGWGWEGRKDTPVLWECWLWHQGKWVPSTGWFQAGPLGWDGGGFRHVFQAIDVLIAQCSLLSRRSSRRTCLPICRPVHLAPALSLHPSIGPPAACGVFSSSPNDGLSSSQLAGEADLKIWRAPAGRRLQGASGRCWATLFSGHRAGSGAPLQ